jgi:hypothetical protein
LLATIAGGMGRAFVMDVHLAGRYRAWMWLLLVPTFGIGTLGLWAYSLRWPRIVDGEGIRLRSGRQVPWTAIKGLGMVKSGAQRSRGSTSISTAASPKCRSASSTMDRRSRAKSAPSFRS